MRSRDALALSLAAFSAVLLLPLAKGHGRLIDPPARSTAWRFGFHTPVNYNDNEVFCGGFSVSYYLCRTCPSFALSVRFPLKGAMGCK